MHSGSQSNATGRLHDEEEGNRSGRDLTIEYTGKTIESLNLVIKITMQQFGTFFQGTIDVSCILHEQIFAYWHILKLLR